MKVLKEKGKKRYRPDITIGTDPEFALIDSRSGGIKGANSYSFFASSNSTAKIGCDGAGTPVEIRPSPVKITETNLMIDEIYNIFYRIAKFCKPKGLIIQGGAMGGNKASLPIGSHIHFGGAEFLPRKKGGHDRYHRLDHLTIQEKRTKLTKCLDTYLVPIMNFFIPNIEIHNRRKSGYGNLGECRTQPWGIEYRTPYSFLLTPLLTAGIYSLASLIAFNYKKIVPNKNLYFESVLYYDNLANPSRSLKIQRKVYKKIKPMLLQLMSNNSPNVALNSQIISLFNLIEQKKTCKNRNVLANYDFGKMTLKPPQFTVHYGRGSDLKYVRSRVEHKVNNKSAGEIYIYQTDNIYDGYKTVRSITLSRGLPKLFYNKDTITRYNENTKAGYKYHIGLSHEIIHDILRNSKHAIFLYEYLNKLRLRL